MFCKNCGTENSNSSLRWKNIFLIIFLLLSTTILSADTYVDGYSRSDGTYVEGHYRSSPNDTVYDNYSTDGNVNPYTGKEGTKEVYDGEGYASSQLASSNSINKNNDDTGLIVFGVIAVVILFVAIIRYLMGFMFISYLVVNAKNVFWTWVILTLINQILFFGACLHLYCILASIPHVSLFTFGIMYLMYKTALTTYDPKTGYNEFGYDKDGFDQYGYQRDGYDRDGYNRKGINRNGKDRLGKGFFGRMFTSKEHDEKICKMNEEAIMKNTVDQYATRKMELKAKLEAKR